MKEYRHTDIHTYLHRYNKRPSNGINEWMLKKWWRMLIGCGSHSSHNGDKLTGGMTVESQLVESGKQADEVDENDRLGMKKVMKN